MEKKFGSVWLNASSCTYVGLSGHLCLRPVVRLVRGVFMVFPVLSFVFGPVFLHWLPVWLVSSLSRRTSGPCRFVYLPGSSSFMFGQRNFLGSDFHTVDVVYHLPMEFEFNVLGERVFTPAIKEQYFILSDIELFN